MDGSAAGRPLWGVGRGRDSLNQVEEGGVPGLLLRRVVTWPWVRAKKRLGLRWCRRTNAGSRRNGAAVPCGAAPEQGADSEQNQDVTDF